jgi:PleD family two-component response regulator
MSLEPIRDKKKKAPRVFLATQSLSYRNNLASTLRMQGYDVDLSEGGFHLLHMLEVEKNIDLVIIHEDQADMSAYEIVSLIRVNKSKTELPVIFISRHSKEENIADMLSVETNDYIVHTPAFGPILNAAKKYC